MSANSAFAASTSQVEIAERHVVQGRPGRLPRSDVRVGYQRSNNPAEVFPKVMLAAAAVVVRAEIVRFDSISQILITGWNLKKNRAGKAYFARLALFGRCNARPLGCTLCLDWT